jgi:phage shock protein PspC (stress-responsive transcriptional regulator)
MNATTSTEPGTSRADQSTTSASRRPNLLVRSRHDRMIGGVAAGMARYLGVDLSIIRIGFVVLAIVGGLGIPLYLACWLLIPDEYSAQSIAAEFTSNSHAWHD